MAHLADEWTDWFNPPDYEREQYDKLSRNSELKASSVQCGEKPAEAPDCTNGCLFNVRKDPCEYNDLSESKSEVFEALKEKLEQYRKEMVKPRYKHDEDPNANPRNHGGVWTPWIEPEGHPVEHKPLPPGEKLPGQPEKQSPDGANKDANTPTSTPTQATQGAPSQQAMIQQQQPYQPIAPQMMPTAKKSKSRLEVFKISIVASILKLLCPFIVVHRQYSFPAILAKIKILKVMIIIIMMEIELLNGDGTNIIFENF